MILLLFHKNKNIQKKSLYNKTKYNKTIDFLKLQYLYYYISISLFVLPSDIASKVLS